jgi:hypothetical protein
VETALRTGRVGPRVLLSAAGALGMIGGLMVLLDQVRSAVRIPESLVAGAVATAGGAALIFLPRLGLRVRPAGVATVLATAVAGTAAGLFRVTEVTRPAFAYNAGRGYPFLPLRRGDTGETPALAKAAALRLPWNVHADALLADLAFWGFAGVLLAVAVALLRRALRAAT